MKKITLLTLTLLTAVFAYAQIPSNAAADFTFSCGSLNNKSTAGVEQLSNFIATGTVSGVDDREGNANSALGITSGNKVTTPNLGTVNYNLTTTSFWVKMDDKTSGSTRIMQFYGNYSGQGNTGFRMEASFTATTTTLNCFASGYNNGSYRGYSSSAEVNNLDDGQWHHIAVQSKVTGNTVDVEFYIDNVHKTDLNINVSIPTGGVSHFIRRNSLQLAPLSDFDGAFDDVRVYWSTLSTADRTKLFNETPASPKIVYVNHAATGANNGTSWADAFQDARDAFNSLNDGDQVWMAKGKYIRTGTDRNVSFGWTADCISLYGGFSGDGSETSVSDRDWSANETILSGDLGNDNDMSNNAYCVFLGPFAQTANTAIEAGFIDGIIFSDGNANSSGTNKFGRYGGGTFIESHVANVTFTNCTWRDNQAVAGGGIAVTSEFATKNITFKECRFTNNKARIGAPFNFHTFGKNQTITMISSLVDNNEIIDMDGSDGADGHGGVFVAYNGGTLTGLIANTTWSKNKNTSSSTEKILVSRYRRFGSASANLDLHNCIFSDNENMEGNLDYRRIASNSSGGVTKIYNCLFDDTTAIGNHSASGMKIGKAQFVDVANNNFRITPSSPAKDAGDAGTLPLSPTDLDGHPRVRGTEIDMGCYEIAGSAAINRIKTSVLSIYPNPATSSITISNIDKIERITIISLTGKTVLEQDGINNRVNISSLQSGVYIVEVRTTSGVSTVRLLKN